MSKQQSTEGRATVTEAQRENLEKLRQLAAAREPYYPGPSTEIAEALTALLTTLEEREAEVERVKLAALVVANALRSEARRVEPHNPRQAPTLRNLAAKLDAALSPTPKEADDA